MAENRGLPKPGALIAVAAVAVGGLMAAGAAALSRHIAEMRPQEKVPTRSGIARIRHTATAAGEPIRVLSVGGGWQSACYEDVSRTEPVFPYMKGFDRVFDSGASVRSMLVLGGGGCSYPRHVVYAHPDVAVDVVEVDPAMVEIARDHFHLDDAVDDSRDEDGVPRLNVYVADALRYVGLVTEGYDVVINDAFSAQTPDPELASPTGVGLVHGILNPGGVYVVNLVVPAEDPDRLFAMLRMLGTAFDHLWVVRASDEGAVGYDNYLLFASDAELHVPGSITL